jgi:aryl-alcohol dehydrogenase-like predicted oxidoreductase
VYYINKDWYLNCSFICLVWKWTPKAEKDAKEAFDKAFELGISFYDTGRKKR